MAQVETSLRLHLSDWKVWMVIAYLGLVSVIVALFVLFGQTAHEEAVRAAAARSSASTQVGQCFTSVRNQPVVNGFMDAHEALIDNSLIANRAALEISAGHDPLRNVRLQSIKRLEKAKRNLGELRALIGETTPTEAKCVQLAHMLRVDPTRYLKPPAK